MKTPSPHRGRIAMPVLALLAGMGLVVQGSSPPGRAWVPLEETVAAEPVERVGGTVLRGATAPSLVLSGERSLDRRTPRARVTGGAGHVGADPTPDRPGAVVVSRTIGLLAGPRALSSRAALARAGRLSAPSTAPPASPS